MNPHDTLSTTPVPASLARYRPALIVGVLTLLTAIAYANSLRTPFVFDDEYQFKHSTGMQSLAGAWAAPPARRMGFLTFALNYELHGLWLPGYHAANIAIHAAGAVTLFLLTRALLKQPASGERWRSQADGLAAIIAAIWAVHPLQTAAVTYIIQRYESQMGLFILVSLYALLGTLTASRWRYAWMAASLLASIGAIFTKEVAIVFPLVALAFDRVYLSSSWRALGTRRGLLHGANFAVAGWAVYLSRVLLDPTSGVSAGFGVKSVSPWEYLRSQPQVLLHYLRLTFWPDQLCLDYAWPIAQSPWSIYPAGAVILGLLALTVWGLWRAPRLGFLGLAFFVILAPTSSFVPLLDLAFEHRIYLPLASLVVLVVLGAAWLLQSNRWTSRWQEGAWLRVGWSAAVLVVVSLAVRTGFRNADYASPIRIWQTVAAASPWNHRAHVALAIHLTSAGRIAEAEEHLRTAIELNPSFAEAYINLGTIRMRQNRFEEAEVELKRGLQQSNTAPLAYYNLGVLRDLQDRFDEAFEFYQLAVQANPSYLKAWGQFAKSAERVGRDQAARDAYRKLLELDPRSRTASLGLIHLLARSDDASVRDPAEALQRAEQLNHAARGRDRLALEALAAAQASHGDAVAAIQSLTTALQRPGDSASATRIRRTRDQLSLANSSDSPTSADSRSLERTQTPLR
jgi:Flp pilus assembly protein TadD